MVYDVIVIGAGLAGLMAAEAAQRQGARVLILARGMGSLPLTTGCIDGLGYFPSDSLAPLPSPLKSLSLLQINKPQHPYAKLGAEKILSAISHFQDLCCSAGIPYEGTFEANFLIPTPLGTIHPSFLVPKTMTSGHLSLPGLVLLLGFSGFKDFSPVMAAQNLNALHSQSKIAPSFRAHVLEGVDLGGKAIIGPNFANAFDQEDFREGFVRQVRPLLRPGERLGLPAVLGLHHALEAWEDLQKKMEVEIFEIPLPPPSVPGMRLYSLLQSHLREKGVRVIMGATSLKPLVEQKWLKGFNLGGAKNSPNYKASAFILATGKFVGGGLDSDRGRIFETLLDLPVRYPQNRSEWFRPRLLAPEGQPFNSFGVEVDENLQPLDLEGRIIYKNLFAAGGIIAQADSMSEKSGGGVAVSTGYQAGKLAANFVRGSSASSAISAGERTAG